MVKHRFLAGSLAALALASGALAQTSPMGPGPYPAPSISTPVSVANGGSGNTSLAVGALNTGNGTGAYVAVSPGASGTVLTSNGMTSAPSYQTVAGGSGCAPCTTAQTVSANGALSVSAYSLTGTPYTGGTGTTTLPYFYFNMGTASSTLSTSGTIIGLNAPSGWAGNILDLFVNGSSTHAFVVNQNGALTAGSNIYAGSTAQIGWSSRTLLTSSAQGHINLGSGASNNPTVSACGTETIDTNANDTVGTINITAGTPSSCTVTFKTAFTTYNHCLVTAEATTAAFQYSYTLSALTFTGTALAGKYDYFCPGT